MRNYNFILTAAALLAGLHLTTAQITTSEIKTEDTGGVTTISGDVGIGTLSPFQKLSLIDGQLFIGNTSTNQFESGRLRFSEHSNSFIGGYLHYDGIGNVLNLGVHEASNSEVNDDVNAISILRSNGNVGIGTENPVYKLDVNGFIKGNRLVTSDGNATSHIFNYSTNQNLYIGAGKDNLGNKNEIILYNYSCLDGCNVPRIRLLGDYIYTPGNIGIGTLSPSAKLDIIGSGDNLLRLTDTLNNNGLFIGTDLDLSNYIRIRPTSGEGIAITNNGDTAGLFVKADNANVGIGTTNPSAKLEVSGPADNAAIILDNDNIIGFRRTDGALVYGIGHTNGEFVIGKSANLGPIAGTPVNIASGGGHIKFTQGTEERMRIASSGNIGIGTNNPDAKLTVKGGSTFLSKYLTIFDFDDGISYSNIISRDQNTMFWTGGVVVGGYSNDALAPLGTGNMLIKGNLGIGTTNPSEKLHVNGNIRASAPLIWPDYVFHKNYKLPKLSEVETHIKENGHLKNIPSEKEVLKNGIDLTEMDAKLLQKIEELTLYTIQQQKLIEKVLKQNEKLAKRIETIENQ